jgi:transposase
MRKGFDSLSGIVRGQMQFDPLSKDVYVFINRRHTQLKLLQWEGDGFAVYYKRLEKGSYTLPVAKQQEHYTNLTETQLQMMLEGISMKRRYHCKRYQHIGNNC